MEKRGRKLYSNIEREKTNGGTHDMGFKIYCSFGNGFRLTNDPHYKEVIIESAKTFVNTFNPKAGVIRSWDHHKEQWDYPVIIDNMMNLELLFEATKLTGDSSFHKIAITHATYNDEKSLSCQIIVLIMWWIMILQRVQVRKNKQHRVMQMNQHGREDRRGDYMGLRCVIALQRTRNTWSRPKRSHHLFLIIPICLKTLFLTGILMLRIFQMNQGTHLQQL